MVCVSIGLAVGAGTQLFTKLCLKLIKNHIQNKTKFFFYNKHSSLKYPEKKFKLKKKILISGHKDF